MRPSGGITEAKGVPTPSLPLGKGVQGPVAHQVCSVGVGLSREALSLTCPHKRHMIYMISESRQWKILEVFKPEKLFENVNALLHQDTI